MNSLLESLPLELLTQITGSLEQRNISALMRTSRKLYHNLESSLYRSKEARNRALRWVCTHGHVNIIRRLISVYESSPSVVDRGGLTLNLALKAQQLDAFQLLLQLGAGIDGQHENSHQLRTLVRELSCSSASSEFARAFFKAGRAAQLPRRLLDVSLMMMVRHQLPVDLVELVLNHGASVNKSHSVRIGSEKTWANPLSASILFNSRPVFDLLRNRGASIHGTVVNYPRRRPLHIPIYAAAYSILEHGTHMFQSCLDNGADINHGAVLSTRAASRRYHYGTPLLGYLDSIESWPVGTNVGSGGGPLDHLGHLLNSGAIISDNLPTVPFPGPHGRPHDQTAPHSSLHLLLDNMKGNLNQLADAQFQAVAKLLIQHGALSGSGDPKVAAERIKRLLLDYDHGHRGATYPASVVQAWRAFVTLLLDSACSLDETNGHVRWQDALLSDYIYDRGTDSGQAPTDLTFEAISLLISHVGADINATPLPVLHRLCHFYHLMEATHNIGPNDAYERHHSHGIADQRRRLVSALVEKYRANPDLKISAESPGEGGGPGRTAEEILLSEWEGLEYSETGRRFIAALVEDIKDGNR
ncbi:hypothetical protein QBC37DRAFT_487125 [Rhypophila decipiens]|uniref:F-box domain-containing protein n=1 Tax=Rhypophila decipiens TaxID=261697 RepID=A0AAN6Y0M9_9PEZI|nr:hypothetical protein QBC37DRAFT_487125 [Rhypophila decipiens]